MPVKEIYYSMGLIYEKLGFYALAEQEYLSVSRKLPALMKPKFLLAELYLKTNQFKKFLSISKIILSMKPKKKSQKTEIMIKEITRLLSKNKFRLVPYNNKH